MDGNSTSSRSLSENTARQRATRQDGGVSVLLEAVIVARRREDTEREAFINLSVAAPGKLPLPARRVLFASVWDNVGDPTPSVKRKDVLRTLTRLSKTQLKDWFVNYKKRTWVPITQSHRAPETPAELLLFRRYQMERLVGLTPWYLAY